MVETLQNAVTALDDKIVGEVNNQLHHGQIPNVFLKGVAISTWQNSGDENCNWGEFEKGRKFLGLFPNINNNDRNSPSSDFWNKFDADLYRARHELGCTSFRFSFEWNKIEPEPGKIDDAAIRRYHEILDAMDKYGLVPNATLHHFTHPVWFEKMGGFTRDENVQHFVNYAVTVFKEFGARICLWCTFNEPTCYTFCGFIAGVHPPGKIAAWTTAGKVLKNILRGHTRAYDEMKALPHGDVAQIGLVHHHVKFEPPSTSAMYMHVRPIAKWLTYFWGRDVVPRYMQTGEFEWKVPFWGRVIQFKEQRKPGLDWWGVNYYSKGVISFWLQPKVYEGDVMTDMGYTFFAQGLYDAIADSAVMGVPMYVSETGVADKKDAFRGKCIDGYMNQVLRAIKDGYDLRGFYYWTLVDNFEWNTGTSMRFGLYQWEQDGSVDRKLREGARALIKHYKTLPSDMKQLRAKVREHFVQDDYSVETAHERLFEPPVGSDAGQPVPA